MSVQILSPSRHGHLRWQKFANHMHAAERNLVSLAAAEVGRAALTLPLVLTQTEGRWPLCALLGLYPGQNIYVAPDGRWVGEYIPATLRAHPFHLGWNGFEANLCVDEGSGLLVSDESGEPIFNEAGGLSESVEQVWGFLSATAQSLLALEEACGHLAAAGVIEPWPLAVQGPNGTQTLSGLYRISEAAMNGLEDAVFGQLRRAGIVGVAYAQLLSMGNLTQLGALAQARAEANAQLQTKVEHPPLINLPNDSTIDWDWSKIGR